MNIYAMNALERPRETRIDQAPIAALGPILQLQALIERLHQTPPVVYPGTGLGTTLRLDSLGVHGAALVRDGKLLHLSAYAEVDPA